MAFCSNCGKKLNDGEKFCSECGNTIIRDNARRKTVYDGEIHKCPSCGEVLGSFVTTCPTCGYEVRGARASESVHEFAIKLSQAETDMQRTSLVRNFPIPNTKEDIFEFIILASTNFDGIEEDGENETKRLIDAWLVKVEQGYQKAKMTFPDDPDFNKIQEIYDRLNVKKNLKKREKGKQNRANIIKNNIGVSLGLAIVIATIITGFFNDSVSSLLQLVATLILIISACALCRKTVCALDFVFTAIGGGIAIALSFILHNGSVLQLGCGIMLILVVIMYFKSLGKR